jgi:uncharacterized protein YbjQ (UPF0145 family)
MIISTTPTLEGKKVIQYKGIVFGEVVSGVDFVKDFAANNMMMVIASGTAVIVE